MNFDWTKPVVIDWSGRRGPVISENDIRSSVIKRIVHNQFYLPFCEREYIPVKPWWNPENPFGSCSKKNHSKNNLFIPGLRTLPPYPQLSTLTKQQHLQGLKVMSTRFEFVQPRNYLQPTQEDIASVEEFQALYEAEQKEYLKWTNHLWMNGDCLRMLRPKPTIERVYDAEFRMRAHEMLSMPQQYTLAAQIPLQKESECDMELKEDLVDVNIHDLPMVDYPEEMESDFSVLMRSCPVPEPCKEHPCKFVLPHEKAVSVLPLTEIHRELAQYAASNGSTFIASENALRCLLDTDRSWKIPVSVVEVICPEYGDLKTIVVLGSEFNAQKECSKQRTYKAYKHLLRHTFAPSIGQYKSKSPTKQSTSPAHEEPIILPNNLIPLCDELEVSSDEDTSEKLLIADGERKNDPKILLDQREPKEPDSINKSIEKRIDQCMTEPESHYFIDDSSSVADYLIVDNPNDSNPVPISLNSYKPFDKGVTEPDNSHKRIDEPSSDSDHLTIDNFIDNNPVPSYDLDSFEAFEQCAKKPDNSQEHMDEFRSQLNQSKINSSDTYSVPSYGLDFYEPDYNKDSTKSYSHNEPFRLMDNASKPKSSCGLDFYEPDYSIKARPNYSRDNDDPSSEPDKLTINNPIEMNPESINTSSQDYEAISRNSDVSNYDRPSYRYYDASDEPDRTDSISESIPETNSVLDFHELDCDTRPRNDESSEPDDTMIDDQSNSEINHDSSAIEIHDVAAPIFKITDVSSEINEESFQMLQTSNILDTSSVLETNNSIPPSLRFEKNITPYVNTANVATNTSLVDEHYKSIASIQCEDNLSTHGSQQCEKQNAKAPKTPSPIKPGRISVRNLSISELKVYSIEALLNKPNTEVPETSVTQINDDVSIFNEAPEKFEGPARLGISGIISRNPSTSTANKTIVNNPVVKTDEVLRLGESKNNNNKSSLKLSDSKSVKVSNADNTKDVHTNIETGVSQRSSGTYDNIEVITEAVKEVPKSSEISRIMTGSRSLSGTDNKGVNEKSKELTPKLKKSRIITRNQNAKIDDPMIEKANEVSSLGITGMITRNRSLSGTEVLEKSNEVTPKLEKSKKNRNQKSSICKNGNFDDSIIEKANEVSSLGITGMITRNRSLSATNNGTEDIEHTEKSPKKTRDINKNLTSPKKLSKEAVSIAPVGNVYTRISQNLDIETNKHSSENVIHGCVKDEVNVHILRESIELSPVNACSVSVEPIDIETYVGKSISETNISGIEQLDKSPRKTYPNNVITKAAVDDKQPAMIDTLQSATKTRKRSIIESNSEILVIERHNNANLKTYSQKSNKNAAAKKKSPHKPCIKKSTISIKNCFIETEDNCILDDSDQPSTKRVRKLSELITLEHNYCTIAENSQEPRKRSISEVEHDYCGANPSFHEESDTNMLFVDCVPAVVNYIKHFDIFKETFDASIFNNKILEGNITSSKPSSNTTRSRKIRLSELFGDDTDSDEPIVQNSMKTGRNQKYDIKKLSFTDPIDKPSTEKSPVKPCIRKSNNDSPRNSKRKISFSDPITSDPEFNTCVGEQDSGDSIAGFLNGVAVPCKTLTKNIKKKETIVNRRYGLRSRKKTNTSTAKKSNIAQQKKDNGRFTKIIPDKQTNARNIHRSSDTNLDSDVSVSRSRQDSLASKQNIDTNKQKIQITSLRRSRRLSTRTNADNSDQLPNKKPTAKTNAKHSLEITKGRFSDCLRKENVQRNTKDIQYDLSKSLSKNTSNIFKRDKNRRKSLPSNIFSETTKKDLILRSKSLTNLNEKTDKLTSLLSQTNLYNTRSKFANKKRSDSLKLSERTKRYLRRVFNFDCSESDQSDHKISQHTHISSGIEKSDTENKKTRRCTRSSILNSKETMTKSKKKIDYTEKTKRFTRRSAASYSSCDEMELLPPVSRIETKSPGIINTNCSTNTVASAESNTEQFETDEIKTKPKIEMDTTEIAQQKKENGRFTKIIPDKLTNARNIHRSSESNLDSDDSVSRSRQDSLASKQNIDTNKQKIQIRRSRRLSTRTNAENSDQLTNKKPTAKTNAKDSLEITKGRRFSDCSKKENVQRNTKDTQYDLSKSLSKNTSNIFKRDKNRRKSLPSNIFSETTKKDLILRSKSLTNLNEKTDKLTSLLSQTSLYNTRSKFANKNRSDSLKLSERTKRYLRRVFNCDCSESDQSDDKISQHTHISSGTEKSDTENKKTRRCTRSSILDSKETMTISKNKIDYIEQTERFTRRSAASYSSCDEMELLPPVSRIETKRPGIINTNCSTNTVASAESNTEQFETDEIKTEPKIEMDTTEKFQIEIDVFEEKTESVEDEKLPGLHFIELPTNSCEGNASHANGTDENLNMSNNVDYNETDIELGSHRSTDALIVTNEFIDMNQREPNENSKEIQQFQNMDTKCTDSSSITLKNSADADSDSSDFFNMCVDDEFNILHFTATNESDSEEECLSIDDSQSNITTDSLKQSPNNKPKDLQPKTPQNEKCNLFGESSKSLNTQAPNKKYLQPKTPETVKCNLFGESSNQTEAPITKKVENIKTQSPSITPIKNLRSKDAFASTSSDALSRQNKALEKKSLSEDIVNDVIGVFNCTCKDTPFEVPPPRSFKKWRVRNKNSQIGFNVIVHSSHRVRKGTSEVLLEPIVEYQPELGGSRQPRGRVRATALALMLRQNADLINVRIDYENGNVIVIDRLNNDKFIQRHGDKKSEVADTLHTAFDQLRFLMPGQYVLAHDPSHGTNAMLYSRKGVHDRGAGAGVTLSLQETNINMPDAEDALLAKIAPQLDLVMLPYHKHHSILPLAFTPHRLGIREEQKIAATLARARAPPSAIQWPKKKKKSKKRSTRQNVTRPQQQDLYSQTVPNYKS